MSLTTPSIELDKTFNHTISDYGFGNLSNTKCKEILRDGRVFAHFVEVWICENYPLIHVKGCKKYDLNSCCDYYVRWVYQVIFHLLLRTTEIS